MAWMLVLTKGTELLLNWNEKVKSLVPPERLLVMNVKEGWAPLCKFLDMPIPAEPFPRANDGDAANKAAEEIFSKLIQGWLLDLPRQALLPLGLGGFGSGGRLFLVLLMHILFRIVGFSSFIYLALLDV